MINLKDLKPDLASSLRKEFANSFLELTGHLNGHLLTEKPGELQQIQQPIESKSPLADSVFGTLPQKQKVNFLANVANLSKSLFK